MCPIVERGRPALRTMRTAVTSPSRLQLEQNGDTCTYVQGIFQDFAQGGGGQMSIAKILEGGGGGGHVHVYIYKEEQANYLGGP